MSKLWLKYTDPDGESRRVGVDRPKFVIGRHSECDLTIADPRLSRQHAIIETFGSVSVISDAGSSNGTELNGNRLTEPVGLKDGDIISFGGFEATIELIADAAPANNASVSRNNAAANRPAAPQPSLNDGGSIPTFVLVAAPLLALAIVLCGGGALFYFRDDRTANGRQTPTPYVFDEPTDETPATTNSPSSSLKPTVSPAPTGSNPPSTPEISDEKKKIGINAAEFLRSVALNDQSAYLKDSEIELVNARVKQLQGSASLADNLRAVKNSASQFKSMAEAKGLKPQFLAAAALTELGSNRGNPVETAQRMLPVFEELRISLANNLADDNLLMIAAYNQGKSGQYKALRNTLEALAKKNAGVSPREIRTIWFLKKQGKITEAEFDHAIRFIAAGTIMQNPKEFGVNAESFKF